VINAEKNRRRQSHIRSLNRLRLRQTHSSASTTPEVPSLFRIAARRLASLPEKLLSLLMIDATDLPSMYWKTLREEVEDLYKHPSQTQLDEIKAQLNLLDKDVNLGDLCRSFDNEDKTLTLVFLLKGQSHLAT